MHSYDRQGNPITTRRWGQLHDDVDYVQIDDTHINGLQISTVWLGLDHAYGRGDPVIFETMFFGPLVNNVCVRYSTEAQARAGHEAAIRAIARNLLVAAAEGIEDGPIRHRMMKWARDTRRAATKR